MPGVQRFSVDTLVTEVKEVRDLGIQLGDPVAPRTNFEPLATKGRYVAKAFDNRVGVAGIIEAPESWQDAAVREVWEETGLRVEASAALATLRVTTTTSARANARKLSRSRPRGSSARRAPCSAASNTMSTCLAMARC